MPAISGRTTFLPVIFDGGVKNAKTFEFLLDFAFKVIIPTETLESIDEMEKMLDGYLAFVAGRNQDSCQ